MHPSTSSLWIETQPAEPYPALAGDITADVAVIGGGITGVTAALLLARAGLSVVLVEARRVGEVDTGHTTAHVTELLDTRYHTLISDFGEEGATMAAASQRAAIERIAAFIREEHLECDFLRVPGFLYAETAEQEHEIEREAKAAVRVGLDARIVRDTALPFPVRSALRIEDQAQFHPLRYLRPLAAALARESGARVFEHTRALDFEDGSPCRVVTEKGVITARDVLVTTYSPVANKVFLHTKIAAYRTYALAMRGQLAEGLYWDTADPYHYTRTQPYEGGQLLIVGGEDHKTGTERDTDAPFARLEAYARARFGDGPILHRWSGQILEPIDGLPFIGKNSASKHTYVATGYAGNGMTSGTFAGMLLADLVRDASNPYAWLYDATRMKPIAGAATFLQENIDYPKHLIGDRLKSAEAHGFLEIAPGEGKILTVNGHKLAVYRGESGGLTALSPVCTHLGCHVTWNTAERSWDCPCHGSRFDTQGQVINGPSTKPLEQKPL